MGLRQQLLLTPGKAKVTVLRFNKGRGKVVAEILIYVEPEEIVNEIKEVFRSHLDPDEVKQAQDVARHQAASERRKKARNIFFALEGTIWWKTIQPTR
jgi:hypothetical protein